MTDMEKGICLKGSVEKIKIVKLEETPLIRFTLTVGKEDKEEKENCLIRAHSLDFLYQVTEGNAIVIYGRKNKRNQVVVQKYHVNQ
ncbi:Hypothetical protein TR210_2301 [Trichococcus ilyis]|uniref:Uncharacterized protein n=2 Tax=Trichococcus ilyis TaxID=640938 RepID=A0A143Z7Z3_9LACT|nr:Hypothetical protein TR210_2301 [Trichococcus ilyis]